MSLNKITIQNFKMIEYLQIFPGKINQIVGDNNQGKTTIIEAIQFAMVGSTDISIIRHGAKKAIVELSFKDGLEVVRALNHIGNQTLDVHINDLSPQRPQSYLNRFVGVGTFNPSAVLDPKKRHDYLLQAIDVKVTKEQLQAAAGEMTLPDLDYDQHGLKVIDRASKYFYDVRTALNRDIKNDRARHKTFFSELGNPPQASKIEGTDSELLAARKSYEEDLHGLRGKHHEWSIKNKTMENLDMGIEKRKEELATLQQSLEDACKIKSEFQHPGEEPNVAAESEEIARSINAVSDEISARAIMTSYKKQKAMIEAMDESCKKKEDKSLRLSIAVNSISKGLTTDLIQGSDLPVEGLTFDDGVFRINGDEVEQLASSRALRLALAITKKLNKKSNLICIDGAELLDEQTYKDLHKEMESDQFNYFLARVGSEIKGTGDKIVHMVDGKAS